MLASARQAWLRQNSAGFRWHHRASGDECLISLDLWIGIKDGLGVEQTVGLVQALLSASESTPRH